ncbi:alpha/beta hydrolase [Jeongeupia sp. HS-3]|uniref:alpha/beta hydrolase n=1 Tax=Jeongeupia sp. HS-3 TaxID=1009682 RepID=UPI0018A55E54|nr:alpha/beta fold hydrolase [Jeongeupia sp. HS-3]BCL75837.1 alpha/beta hydrolase [Jeongeupia sp. HS-3]
MTTRFLHVPPSVPPRAAPPLLFIHGAYVGAWCWQTYFLPWFAAQGYDCYALSLPGHAERGGRDRLDHFGLDDYVADIVDAMTVLPATPVLIGHSLGGWLAQEVAEQVSVPGLALLASVPPYGLAGSLAHMSLASPRLLLGLGRFQLAHAPLGLHEPELHMLRELLFSSGADDVEVRRFVALAQPESTRALTELMLPRPWRMWRAAPERRCLVIGCDGDQLISRHDVDVTAKHWRVTPHFVPGGHALMADAAWLQAARLIDAWLAE